jgi:hypothetical protein
MNAIMKILKDLEAKIISHDFNESCQISFYIRKQNGVPLEEKINQLRGPKLNYLRTI